MGLITEAELRAMWKHLPDHAPADKVFHLKKKDILTPSARSYLLEKNIAILAEQAETETLPSNQKDLASMQNPEVIFAKEIIQQKKFRTELGISLDEKPEYMTHLKGNFLVFKDHPIIVLRGNIDHLETELLLVQAEAVELAMPKLAEDLEEVLTFIRNLIRAEVMNEPLRESSILGMTEADLRQQSHFPKKYFQLGHFMPDYHMPKAVLLLNRLRALTRKTEISAYQAFKHDLDEENKIKRTDIIQALNRLSSLFYIMMFWVRTGKYQEM